MMNHFKNASKREMFDLRGRFISKFLSIRNKFIINTTNKIYKAEELNKEIIQTRLNDKILIF